MRWQGYVEGHGMRGRVDAVAGLRGGDVRRMGGNGEAVSGFPAPPLGQRRYRGGGSEQPHRLPRVPVWGGKPFSPDAKGRQIRAQEYPPTVRSWVAEDRRLAGPPTDRAGWGVPLAY